MPTAAEISQSLKGAWALLWGDAAGMRRLDTSLAGFWRSFAALLVAAPVYLVFLAAEWRLIHAEEGFDPEGFDARRYFLMKSVGYAGDWLAYPLAMVALAPLLSLGRVYVPHIVAYNWSGVVASALLVPPTALFAFGLLPEAIAFFLTIMMLGLVIRYRYFVARLSLNVGAATAAGLVAFDVLLSLTLGQIVNRAAGL